MSRAVPVRSQVVPFDQGFAAVLEILEWTYGITLEGENRMAIEREAKSAWAHPDGTVQQLLTYLDGLHRTMFDQPEVRRELYRPAVQVLFATLFAQTDGTERGRLLALLHRILRRACYVRGDSLTGTRQRPSTTTLPPRRPYSDPAFPRPGRGRAATGPGRTSTA